jgi:hypothetical protein
MATIWLLGQNTRTPHPRTFKTKAAAIAFARTVYPGQVYFVWKQKRGVLDKCIPPVVQ